MSWILDIENDLVNLDVCETIECDEVEMRGGEEPKWAVLAVRDRAIVNGANTLLEGSEQQCRNLMNILQTKLSMVKR